MISERLRKAFEMLGESNAYSVDVEQALARVVAAAEEHIECEPGMYANECVGLGGADGLKQALAALELALKEVE